MDEELEGQGAEGVNDGELEGVDIELTDDDLGGEPEADAGADTDADVDADAGAEADMDADAAAGGEGEVEAEGEEAPKRKRSPDKRIAEMARRAQEAERRAQELESRLNQEAELRRQSDSAMMTHYEQSLQGRAGALKQQLIDAHSIGDSERVVELQTEYFKIQADLGSIENWKAQQEIASPEPKKAVRQEQQTPQLDPRTMEWVSSNTWFQPQSPDFDAEMHEEATLYARRIERRYRAEGREDEIGGIDYFTEIDRHMAKEFPDAFTAKAAPSRKAPPMTRDTNVAPVQRSGVPGQPMKNPRTVTLSQAERQLAHSLAASGAIKGAGGKRLDNKEAEKYFAIQKMKQMKGN